MPRLGLALHDGLGLQDGLGYLLLLLRDAGKVLCKCDISEPLAAGSKKEGGAETLVNRI